MATKQQTSKSMATLASRLMREYDPLPMGQSGPFAIVEKPHVPGDKLMVVGFREAIFTGLPVTDIILTEAYTVQKLTEDDGVWMSSLPCELVQMHNEGGKYIKQGARVLIGGLGLGIVAGMAHTRRAKQVTVVELDENVIKLNESRRKYCDIVQSDLLRFIEQIKPGQYDIAFYDIWQSDGEWTWQSVVVPLRRKTQLKIKKVHCWHEDVMKGQVWANIFRYADVDPERIKSPGHCHKYAFRKAAEALGLVGRPRIDIDNKPDFQQICAIEQENRGNYRLHALASVLVNDPGTVAWEGLFGKYWDEAMSHEVRSVPSRKQSITIWSKIALGGS